MSSGSSSDYNKAKANNDVAGMTAARAAAAQANNANSSATQGSYNRTGTWTPSSKSAVNPIIPYANLTNADLLSGNFDRSFITGNSLALDSRVNNAQRAMIQSNFYAKQGGNVSPYSAQDIANAGQGGVAGWSYAPGKSSYSYVQNQAGGQHSISPTQRTDQLGNTVAYRGVANEPVLGAYNNGQGKQTPQDMNYSWERTGGLGDLLSNNYSFNQAGADVAAARNITTPADIRTASASIAPPATTATSSITNTASAGNAKQAWEVALENYKANPAAGHTEISRAGQVYNQKMAAGDTAGAQAAHTWANQIREALGISGQYDQTTGELLQSATTQLAETTAPDQTTQQTGLQQIQDMIANIQQNQAAAPTYQTPDYSNIIPAAAQGVSITTNPADTTFVPTSRYNDRVQQARQAADSQAMDVFNANMNIYNANRDTQQQQVSNLVSILPYTTTTAAQQAELDQQTAQAILNQQIQEQKDKQWQAEQDLKTKQLELNKKKVDYDLGKPYYAPKSGGSETKTTKEPTTINQRNTQSVIAELLPHNATGRKNLFNKNSAYWAENGVDIMAVMEALGL